MISTLEIDSTTDPTELKKLLRKKLMTGGAVIRLRSGASKLDQRTIFDRFAPVQVRHSAAALVLVELAGAPDLDPAVLGDLIRLESPEIDLALLRRSDIDTVTRHLLEERRLALRGSGSMPAARGSTGR